METESSLGTLFLFFRGEFLGKSDCINVHGVGVFGGPWGYRGKGLESLDGPLTLLSDLLSTIPLILEVGCLGVPFVDFVWNSIERHDPLHEWGRDSSSEEANEDIVVRDAGASGVTLEG